MKTLKKFSVWLCFLALVPGVLGSLLSARASALTEPGGGTGGGVSYTATWVDRSHIQVTGSDGSSAMLTDSQWDGNWDFTGTIDGKCSVEIDGFKGNAATYLGYQPGWNASKSIANISVQRLVNTSCVTDTAPGFKETDHKFPIGSPANAQIAFAFADPSTIQRIDSPSDWTFTNPQKQSNGSTWYYRSSESSDTQCVDVLAVLPGNTQMKLYEQNTSDPGTKTKSPIDANCWLESIITNMSPSDASIDTEAQAVPSNFAIGLESADTFTQVAQSSGTAPSNNNSDGNACEAQNNTGIEWLICGILRGLDAFMTLVNNYIENQLVINVSQNLNANVKQAWNVFRILSSALLVVIMLVMVFSQAIGSGPFDAYTVKKLLPRLVAAVIFIQLSWYFAGWAVSIANDLGKGIADLIALPFGGTDQLGLDKLVGQLGAAAPGLVGVGGLISIGIAAWVTPFGALLLGFIIITGAITAMGVLLIRQALIIGAVIFMPLGLVAWILPGTQKYWKSLWDNFSKALLLFPLIIGMIYIGRVFAWIVSTRGGTPGILDAFAVVIGYFGPYFLLPKAFNWGGNIMKMAADNIEKGVEKMGGAKGKEFIQDRQKRLRELRRARSAARFADPNKYKGLSQVWQKPIDRFRGGAYDPTLGLPGSELRTQQKGAFMTEGNEYLEKQEKEALARAQHSLEERLSESHELKDENGKLLNKGGNKDDMYQDILRLARGKKARKKYYDYNGKEIDLEKDFMGKGERNHRIARRAALDRMIQLGADTNWSHIDAEDERIRNDPNATAEEKAEWRRFLNANKDQVLEKMPDLLKGTGSVSDISAEGLARMHGAGIKRMLSKLNADATDPNKRISTRTGVIETDAEYEERIRLSQARLNKFLNTAREAITNSNTRGLMEQGGLRAIKAYVTDDPETRKYLLYDDPYKMHADPEDGRNVIRESTEEYTDPADGKVKVRYSGKLLLKPIIDADASGEVSSMPTPASEPDPNTGDRGMYVASKGRDSMPRELQISLDSIINRDGSYDNAALQRISQQTTTSSDTTPGQIRVQRAANVQAQLPTSATLATPEQRDAYMIQLRSDPATREALVQGIAYNAFGNDPAGQVQRQAQEVAVEHWRRRAEAGSDQDKAAFNSFIDQLQQAYIQRGNEVMQRQSTPDLSPEDLRSRRDKVQSLIAPELNRLQARKFL